MMAGINVQGLTKYYGRHRDPAVDSVALSADEGELVVLLGPSGCGKTTILRCVAGLITPDQGHIELRGRSVFSSDAKLNVPTHRRDIGLVFQSFALWPHMTARGNIEFPLRAKSRDRRTRRESAEAAAKLVSLSPELLRKRPGQLSGGQQQRVALARALVGEPSVVLFDEPLSNLDALLREQLRGELRALHRSLGFTGIYVTHDLAEARALGDRVVIMRDGLVRQAGRPEDVFDRPASEDVARILGYRHIATLTRSGMGWYGNGHEATGVPHSAPEALSLLVRPESLRVTEGRSADSSSIHFSGGIVRNLSRMAHEVEISVELGGRLIKAVQPVTSQGTIELGQCVSVACPVADTRFYDSQGNAWHDSTPGGH